MGGGGTARQVTIVSTTSTTSTNSYQSQILPWDSDSDVQVSESSMHYLASYYNMTVFHYKTPRIPEGRDYMLEVNPHYVNREQTDKLNVIDARWVDTTSGLFIDITTARYNYTHPAGEGMLSCKDGHEYRVCEFLAIWLAESRNENRSKCLNDSRQWIAG